jgi:hypothetical protein
MVGGNEPGTIAPTSSKQTLALRAKQIPKPQLDSRYRPVNRKIHSLAPEFLWKPPTIAMQPVSANDLIAHEWGTYTSVQGSDGSILNGLHHEEEKLPSFVYERGRMAKGLERIFHNVNQKLETPVIYFYTKQRSQVEVNVKFPKGIISEYYPNATSFKPAIMHAYMSNDGFVPKQGEMTWKGDLLPGYKGQPEPVPADDIWAPSRQVPAAVPFVYQRCPRCQAEVEKFIFYRGIGHFDGWFRVKAHINNTFTLHNQSKGSVPTVFLLKVEGNKAGFVEVGGLKANEKRTVTGPKATIDLETYVNQATAKVAAALIKTGLYKDEAWAMVNTWRRSYFKTQTTGVRVLYIVPRRDTDALLPITIKPKPVELVRTLVGRIEVLTPQVEQEVLQRLHNAWKQKSTPNVADYGRFAEAKLRRALTQITDPGLKAYCQQLIKKALWSY